MNVIELTACSPDPLMSNLKALGIFRIIAEQKDPGIKAYWANERFVLYTSLSRDDIVGFLVHEYKPTPIVAPWNNGSGFYDIENRDMDTIRNSSDERLEKYKTVIEQTSKMIEAIIPGYKEFINKRKTLKDKEVIKKEKTRIKSAIEENKPLLMSRLRNSIDDDVLPWTDAAYVITAENKPGFGTILGTGGNDGNFEISSVFMSWVRQIIADQYADSAHLVENSLFGDHCSLDEGSFAYFYPGGYEGQASRGSKNSVVNPWDFILTIEGTMLFAGNISRRSNSGKAAFPFTSDSSSGGYSTASKEKVRGEIWIPLWDSPATYDEIRHVFREGRSQKGAKKSTSGADFAEAAVTLGIERGITEFQRFGLFERKGQAYFANGIGKISTVKRPAARLFQEIHDWKERIRSEHRRTKESSKTIDYLLRRIDETIIRFCSRGEKRHLQEVLVIAGSMERAISRSSSYKEVAPMPRLSAGWIDACYDGTPEFRLALALASVSSGTEESVRANLLPIEINKNGRIEWITDSPSAVWRSGSLAGNMLSVLERRCIDAQMSGSLQPMLASAVPAPIGDIIRFIEGRVDDGRISDLILPLSSISGIRPEDVPYVNERDVWGIPYHVPESYVSLKSNFPPVRHDANDVQNKTPFEPRTISLLKAGQIGLAAHITRRRLHMSGYPISTYTRADYSRTPDEIPRKMAERLAASLLFPLDESDRRKIIGSLVAVQHG